MISGGILKFYTGAELAIIAGAVVGTVSATGGFGGGPSGGGGQSITAGQATKTAIAEPQRSEQAKRNRRLAASALTRNFEEPKLGIPGLTG